MRKERFAIVVSVIGLAFCAGAQSLNKEIKVERDIVPEYRDADRLPISPVISLPAIARPELKYSLVDRHVGVTTSLFTLPVGTPLIDEPTVYPGYAAVGYMPLVNVGVSAGYRFIDNDKTALGAWMQYNGRIYNPNWGRDAANLDKKSDDYKNHAASLGVNLRHHTGADAILTALADYSYYHYYAPGLLNDSQGVNNVNAVLSWKKDGGEELFYGIGGGFSRFAFINQNKCSDNNGQIYLHRAPIRQNKFNFNGNAGVNISKESKAGIGVDFTYLHTPMTVAEEENTTLNTWLLRLTPSYRYVVRDLSVDLGMKIDITHGEGKAFHIAPDIKAVYRPLGFLGVNIKAGGGEIQNTASSIYFDMPYMEQLIAYENSHVPLMLDAGLTFGPFKGAYLEVFGGWAKANEWMMPFGNANIGLAPVNVSGWHGGVTAGYRYGSTLEAKITAECASGSNNIVHSYYLWRDRAKYVIDGMVTYSPIDKLGISLKYLMRAKRKAGNESLGSVNSANFGVKYRINDKVSVFLDGENLFNKRFHYIGGVPSQGITGLAGVTVKF
ncbi:MAG: TonB-dependent receptor [Paramuribaculum sp.]|nr:TonB-dependent receptor [Paramuribaculum sp.]